jgi:hypothetical protein
MCYIYFSNSLIIHEENSKEMFSGLVFVLIGTTCRHNFDVNSIHIDIGAMYRISQRILQRERRRQRVSEVSMFN